MRPILLFDIDGTLLHVKRSFLREVIQNIFEHFDVRPDFLKTISFAGRTDKDIFTELCSYHDHVEYAELKKLYIREMCSGLTSKDVDLIPGAAETVESVLKREADVGLCTGNFRDVALKKIEAAGLTGVFEFGGYGCLHEDRIELPREADRSYKKLKGENPVPEQYVVIGDTPNDIRCARHFGARSVAVTTGGFGEDELSMHRPDLICDKLEDVDRWLFGQ
jgi:phosphoglycolate phosphatase